MFGISLQAITYTITLEQCRCPVSCKMKKTERKLIINLFGRCYSARTHVPFAPESVNAQRDKGFPSGQLGQKLP